MVAFRTKRMKDSKVFCLHMVMDRSKKITVAIYHLPSHFFFLLLFLVFQMGKGLLPMQ